MTRMRLLMQNRKDERDINDTKQWKALTYECWHAIGNPAAVCWAQTQNLKLKRQNNNWLKISAIQRFIHKGNREKYSVRQNV